jgi:hypothetical protein
MLKFFAESELMEEEEIGKLFEEKFISQEKFAEEIEKIVRKQKCNYIDGIVTYCKINSIDLESVPKLISKPLKEKLKCEAMDLNFLKKTSRAKLFF